MKTEKYVVGDKVYVIEYDDNGKKVKETVLMKIKK